MSGSGVASSAVGGYSLLAGSIGLPPSGSGGKIVVEVLGQKKLTRLRIAHKDRVVRYKPARTLCTSAREALREAVSFAKRAPETVNEIVGIDRIAVGPTAVAAQVKSEFG